MSNESSDPLPTHGTEAPCFLDGQGPEALVIAPDGGQALFPVCFPSLPVLTCPSSQSQEVMKDQVSG